MLVVKALRADRTERGFELVEAQQGPHRKVGASLAHCRFPLGRARPAFQADVCWLVPHDSARIMPPSCREAVVRRRAFAATTGHKPLCGPRSQPRPRVSLISRCPCWRRSTCLRRILSAPGSPSLDGSELGLRPGLRAHRHCGAQAFAVCRSPYFMALRGRRFGERGAPPLHAEADVPITTGPVP